MKSIWMVVKVNIAVTFGAFFAYLAGSKEPMATGALCAITMVAMMLQSDRDEVKKASKGPTP